MAWKCSPYQFLVLITGVCAALLLGAITLFSPFTTQILSPEISLLHPIIGQANAKVEVVVFEDFRCIGCRKFHETMIPEIRSQYIELGSVRCRFVPLALLEGSKPLANAALAVYEISPGRFADYESALFEQFEQEVADERVNDLLLDIATELGGIDIEALRVSIETKQYYGEIDQNLEWARSFMGKKFRLPAVYVNGIAGSTQDLGALKQLIERKQ